MTRNTKDQTLRGRLRQIFLFSWRDCAVCVGILAAAGLLCALLRMIDSSDVYVALIFECAVVLVSRFTDGYLFGLLASVIGVVGVNWIFTYPYMQLNFTISGYPLTFLVMLAVSVVVGTLTTQIKQQEKLRAEAEREKMRGNLLRAVSHDIRTPLTAIVGGIDAILENGSQIAPETSRDLLENMRDESNWLIGVVENLLSVTRMSGASNIKKELEAGEEVLGAAAMKFQRHYPATRVEISAPDTLLMIPMDIILIEQVLINLMENAVQHGKTTTQIALRLLAHPARHLQRFPVGGAAQAQSLVEFALHIADHRNAVKAVLERADVGGIGLYAHHQVKAGVFQRAVLPDQIAQLILGEGAAEEPVQCQNQRTASQQVIEIRYIVPAHNLDREIRQFIRNGFLHSKRQGQQGFPGGAAPPFELSQV